MGREETPEGFLRIERPKRNGSLTGKASGEKKEEPPGLRLPGGIMKNIGLKTLIRFDRQFRHGWPPVALLWPYYSIEKAYYSMKKWDKKEEPPGLRLPGGIMKNISNLEEVLLLFATSKSKPNL